MLSLAVLVTVGYGWAQLHGSGVQLATSDVITSRPGGTGPGPAGAQNILLVGLDTRTDALGNPLPAAVLDALHAGVVTDGGDSTDTMIVVHVPAGGGAVTGFSIPRDSYVDIPGYGTHKINSAYAYGQNTARTTLSAQGLSGPVLAVQSAAAGARTAIATVAQLTGLSIDHYAAVNLAGFAAISQAVGGVPVCLVAPVDDPYSGAVFPAGPQTVAGPAALAFVRQRHGLPGGDLDRIRRQQAFATSLAHTVLAAGTLTDPATLSALLGAVRTNLTVDQGWDFTSLLAQLQSLNPDTLSVSTIPTGTAGLDTSDGQAVQVDPTQVQAYARTLTTPEQPNPGVAGHGPTAQTPATPESLHTAPRGGPRGGARPVVWTVPDPVLAHPAGRAPSFSVAAPGCVN